MKVHLAHSRGPDPTLEDAKCGVWFPKGVSKDLKEVTCKGCLKVYRAELNRIERLQEKRGEPQLQD